MLPKVLLVLLAVPISLLAQTTEPANLVVNGDFSKVADDKPDAWATSGSKADVTQALFPRARSWSEKRLRDGERQCADYTVRFFLVMLSHGVQKVFLHSGAGGRVNDPNFECALFDYGGVPRKLFPAMAALTGLLGPQPACVGQAPLGDLGHAVGFETAKAAVVALWTEGDEPGTRVTLGSRDGIVLLDVVGRKIAGPDVNLSTSPVYVVGPPGKAKELLAKVKVGQ